MILNQNELKASTKTNPNSLAGAITAMLKTYGTASVTGVGAGAINQICKAIAIARGFVAPAGMDIVCIPSFYDTNIDGRDVTGMKFTVKIGGN